jgi:integrase
LVNAQDAIILRLFFEGLDATEIINLKRQNINGNILTVIDANSNTRKIKVDETCIDLINEALNETKYYKKNGEVDILENSNFSNYVDLIKNDYVVRTGITKTNSYKQAYIGTIYRRMKYINNWYGIPSSKYIMRSGMLAMAKKLIEEEGKLGKDQYEKIAKRYKFKNMAQLRKIINEELINEIYNNQKNQQ